MSEGNRTEVYNYFIKNGDLYRSLFDNSSDAIFIHDDKFNILAVNQQSSIMLGYSPDELIKTQMIKHHPQEVVQEAIEAFSKVTDKEYVLFESKFQKIDGSKIDVEISVRIIHQEHPIYQTIAHEISDRKKKETNINTNEERYRHLVETANEGIWSMDYNHITTYVNKSMADMLGYNIDEMLGRKVEDFFFSEDFLFHEEKMGNRHSGNDEIYERRFKRKDGTELWTIVSAKALKDNSGNFIGSFAMFTDITEQKKNQEEREILYAIGEAVNTTSNFEEFVNNAYNNIKRIMYAENCFIALYNKDMESFSFPLFIDKFDQMPVPRVKRLGVTEYILRKEKPLLLTDEKFQKMVDNHEVERFGKTPVSLIGTPLFVHSKPIGVLVVQSYDPNIKYSDRDKDLLSLIGNTLAIAIERKQTESALKEREEKFRTIFENAGDAMYIGKLYPKFKLIDVNDKLCQMLGYTKNEMLEIEISHLLAEDMVKNLEERINKVVTERNVIYENRYKTKDGRIIPVELNSSIINFLGEPAILSVVRDITKRKLIEDELIKTRQSLLDAQEISHVGSWEYNVDKDELIWSDEVFRIFGIDKNDFEGRDSGFVKTIHPDDIDIVNEYRAAAGKKRMVAEVYHRIIRSDGTIRHVVERCRHFFDRNGNFLKALGTVQDITERKLAEEALRKSEELFKSVVNNSNDLTVLTDEKGIVTYLSPQCESVTGYKCEELIGGKIPEIIHPENAGKLTQMLEYVMHNDLKLRDYEYSIIDNKGITRWLSHSARMVKVDGKNLGIQNTIRDITEQKVAEKEKEKLQAQFVQSQKMESVGRLAGGVAHDFNNMLAVILMQTEMALMSLETSSPLYSKLEEIQKAGKRSADLTRQLLAFARQQAVTPKVLNINETVGGMLKMLKRLIGEDISLSWNPSKDLKQVKIDPSQIDQILVNLCVNARDAIDGVGTLIIETANTSFSETPYFNNSELVHGDYVMLAVGDNGCGIDKETLTNIFEPFFTTKEKGKGTGLGLSTVYGIVKQNKGLITVSSEIGIGTTFKIFLPQYLGEKEETSEDISYDSLKGGKETILIVEDEKVLLELTARMLVKLGYKVLEANTADEAIRIADECKQQINLLITDVVMPDMNGKDIAKQVAFICPGIKCLYMSGYTADIIAHQGVLDTGIHFIQKPLYIKDIALKVREVLES